MEPKYNQARSTLEGLLDGARVGMDPAGTVFSYFTGKKTIGGMGWRGIDYYFSKDCKKNPDVDYSSLYYKGGKFVGAVGGGLMQVPTWGGVQVIMLLGDCTGYKILEKQGKEKF